VEVAIPKVVSEDRDESDSMVDGVRLGVHMPSPYTPVCMKLRWLILALQDA
jgi:hypothetical protein